MSKLIIGDDGVIDLRKNPPATRVQVQGGIELPEPQRDVDVVVEPPAPPPTEPLPARQQDTTGLALPVAPPATVKTARPLVLERVDSVDGPPCYAVVGRKQFERLGKHEWHGTRSGHMFRRVKSATGVETILWFHREAAKCNRIDKFVAFLDGDERNCHHTNLQIVNTKEEAKAMRRQALERSANG